MHKALFIVLLIREAPALVPYQLRRLTLEFRNNWQTNKLPTFCIHPVYVDLFEQCIESCPVIVHKSVCSKIPPYFNNTKPLCISYSYTRPIASKIVNCKAIIRDIDVDAFMFDHPICSCNGSPFIYQPAGYIVTGNLSIVGSNVLQDLLTKGPKYREPRSFSWNNICNSIMNAVEDYSRKWAKKEGVDVSALSEWVNAIRHLVKRRVLFT